MSDREEQGFDPCSSKALEIETWKRCFRIHHCETEMKKEGKGRQSDENESERGGEVNYSQSSRVRSSSFSSSSLSNELSFENVLFEGSLMVGRVSRGRSERRMNEKRK